MRSKIRPSQDGGKEAAKRIWAGSHNGNEAVSAIAAALRQSADEATRAENEACAKIAQEALAKIRAYADDHDDEMVPILIDEALAAIRARIARDPVTEA